MISIRFVIVYALLLVAGNGLAQDESIPLKVVEKYDSAHAFIYDFDKNIEPIYYYFVYKRGKTGVSNADAVELLPIKYNGVYTLDTTLPKIRYFVAVKDSLCAMFDHEFNQVTPFIYQYLKDINRQSDEKATDKRQTLYYAMKENKVGVIDSIGTVVLPFDYEKIGPYEQNCFVFMKDGKVGAVNDKNEQLLPFIYDMVMPPTIYIDSLYAVQVNGKWALAHRGGILVTDYIFDNVEYDITTMTLFINDSFFELHHDFTEGLAVVRNREKHKSGYIDMTGTVVLPLQYESAEPFSEGLAAVQREDGWCFINKAGKTVIAGPYYYCPGPFKNGAAVIETEDGSYTIDKTGIASKIAPVQNDSINPITQQEDSINPKAQQLEEQIYVIWNDVNANNYDSYYTFRRDFKPKDVSYLDCEQCNKLVKLICYMRANSTYDTDADCQLFDAIVEDNACYESLMFIIAYYNNYNLFPEKKIKALKRFTEEYAPTTFISYHYGKALINGEGCSKDVQAGIDKLVEATQAGRDDFSMNAKNLLVELWKCDGNKYNNMLGRLCTEYADAKKVCEKYYWVYNETTQKVGLLDSLANEVLPMKYEDVNNNIDDLFVVTTDKGEELVAKGGNVISQKAFKEINLGKFADGSYFISVNDGENWGLLNADGTPATDMVFYDISVPLVFFQKPTLTLANDDNENPLIQYTMEQAFKQGFAIVTDDKNKYGIMDKSGKLVVKCIYDDIQRSDGHCFAATKGQEKAIIKF